jgi:hypothetical protein
MNDWFRSLTVLGMAFVSVVLVTIGLAFLIVPDPAVSSQAGVTPRPAAVLPGPDVDVTVEVPGALPTRVGGMLAVSGDLQGTFTFDREDTDARYGLIGEDARIFFAGDPLAVEQMSFGGLSFFPESEDCTITPGAFNPEVGVAWATLHCADLEDVRDNGVVTVGGTIAMAADMLGIRGDLPSSGGSVDIGAETVEFSEALLFTAARPAVVAMNPYSMQLNDDETATRLNFGYDFESHELVLVNVERDGVSNDVPVDACAIETREVGKLNPRTTVVEMFLRCPEVDVPGLGPVPIVGSLIVDQVEIGF